MFRRTFRVCYRPIKSNFILLPESYFNLVSTYDTGCLSLKFGSNCHYVTWASYAGSIQDSEIGINARVAKEIGLKENDVVKIALVDTVMNLKTINVTPVSSKDWEIIELSSQKLQSTVLEQIRIINDTQMLLIWINNSMQVNLTVDRIRPSTSFGRIDHNTELIVAPNIYNTQQYNISAATDRPPSSKDLSASISKSKSISNLNATNQPTLSRSATLRNITTIKRSPSITKNNRAEKLDRLITNLKKENCRTFEFRVISGKWENYAQICDIFVTQNNLPKFMDLGQCYILKTANNVDLEYYVNVRVITENELFPNNIHQSIEINENLLKLLKIKEMEKVILKPKQPVLNFVEKIGLFPNKKTNYKIVENSFKRFINDNTKVGQILLNQNQTVRLDDDLIVTVCIIPEHFKYCWIDSQILKECKIYAEDMAKKCDDIFDIEEQNDSILSVKDLIKIEKFDKIVHKVVELIKMDLCLDERNSILRQGNILIAGPSNSGKTVTIERILDELGKKPFCCFYDIYYCTRNKGRKVESIQKDLRQIFAVCLNNAPAVVVLENLDILAHSTGDQQTQDGEYFNRVADTVQHLILEYTSTNPIVVIATVTDLKSLNRRLHSSRGRHLFHMEERLPDLEREDRETILKELCSHIDSVNLDYSNLANLTEGYNIGDLVQFVERAIFYAYRINKSNPTLTKEFLSKSLDNTNSYCLQGIQNHRKPKENSFTIEKIPGLELVVNVLEEVLVWPTKYPTIFNESPLRNQAGVLLFGPPGTGKTFLVSQIAHSWNLRLISVKGPELLAKYIGQSEENVRNLFVRARSARPCVLFFDEFDSLAPKRGHDSTGVTDRVVNQLLTELDGVEGLQGVTVIGATSRPELLDPALLRSGRIDRLVECTLPDRRARKKIFIELSKSLNLEKDIDFNYFVDVTDNYTGADIQSILTTANMQSVKEILSNCKEEYIPETIYISQKHLIDAFNNTRPSLSSTDISRYTKTYARFTNKEKTSREFVAKKTTLA